MADPLKPSISLLCKLGSLIIHTDEFLSPSGHPIDKCSIDNLMRDPEVKEWLKQMADNALIVLKR
jgi:hypothetical protein